MLHEVSNGDFRTHMPFEFRDEDGGPVLLYAQSCAPDARFGTVASVWKIWIARSGMKPYPLDTRMQEGSTECSPTAWQDEDGWHVTFIGGGPDRDEKRYFLYQMIGDTLDSLSKPIPMTSTRCGFAYRSRTVTCDGTDIIELVDNRGAFDLELPGAFVNHISYRADNPNRLLIGGQLRMETSPMCIEYDVRTGNHSLLFCDGEPADKCSIFENSILYTKHDGDGRKICKPEVFHRRSFTGVVRRPAGEVEGLGKRGPRKCGSCFGKVDLGPTVRPSCLECAEKHIGASYVLFAEERDGYACRLRGIGHLHEAEDESQAWPTLHNAVRRYRKAFQQSGEMPNWKTLEYVISSIRRELTTQASSEKESIV